MASAVVAAAASVPAAAPALAAGLPEAAAPGCRSVAHLLAVPESGRGVDWLREALQVAVALELATIPPYLCGWWSVGDRTSHVARLIRRIIGDEMYHMGVVCNLLVAVGGRPRITDAALAYPGPLPGGVREEVNVYLSGLNRPFVRDVMMAIEAPEVPPGPRREQLARHRPLLRRPAARLQGHGTATVGRRAVVPAHRLRRPGTRDRPRRRRAGC